MNVTIKPEGISEEEVWKAPVQRIAGPEMLEALTCWPVDGLMRSRIGWMSRPACTPLQA